MAFTVTNINSGTLGPQGLKVTWGTITQVTGDTGGTIHTGFAAVLGIIFTTTSHFGTTVPKALITTSTESVVMVTDEAWSGNYIAFGIGQ